MPAAAQTLARLRAGELQGSTQLDLRNCGLEQLPSEVMSLADTLEVLDLSGNALSTLPETLSRLTKLHRLFVSGNRLAILPAVVGRLPRLDTLGLKANQITEVPASSLAPTLRWLILTDNRITSLPPSLTYCVQLQKLMLAGNSLSQLPLGMGRLQRLELLRLSANRFERAEDALPEELFAIPQLAWLAYAGNPFNAGREQHALEAANVKRVPWSELFLQHQMGEGASGHIHAALWRPAEAPAQEVALKLFKGAVTSDGLPRSEMTATLVAGKHPHLVGVLGVLEGHPQNIEGLVMPRLAPEWAPLAGPPSMVSCTRDVYPAGLLLPAARAQAISRAVNDALCHLHDRGLLHGDLYAHNLLVDGRGNALLSDFGAASFLPIDDRTQREALQVLDRRALQVLMNELSQHSDAATP